MAEYRLNVLALCTYGKFPFPLDDIAHAAPSICRSSCGIPRTAIHQIRWTHPLTRTTFLGELVQIAHARGIRVLIYSCLNLQDESGSHQWTNEAKSEPTWTIQQQVLKRYGIDGFHLRVGRVPPHPPGRHCPLRRGPVVASCGPTFSSPGATPRRSARSNPRRPSGWSTIISSWTGTKNHVPQAEGLTRWKAELPAGNAGGLRPFAGGLRRVSEQSHLDLCVRPQRRSEAGAADSPGRFLRCAAGETGRRRLLRHLRLGTARAGLPLLCESAWGNFGGTDSGGFKVHASEGGVGGDIGARVWDAIKRELYGDGSDFGEGLLTAAKGLPQRMVSRTGPSQVAFPGLVPLLDAGDFDAAAKVLTP